MEYLPNYPVKVGDCSHWNGLGDWPTIKKRLHGMFIRAGSCDSATGKNYTDYALKRNVDGAKSVGLPFGLYWYFRPVFDGTEQAKYFAILANMYRPTMELVCDVESYSAGRVTSSLQVAKFVNYLQAQGYKVTIYTRAIYWNDNIAPNPSLSNLDLWIARYKAGLTGPWSDGRSVPRDWENWVYWQFTADGNGQALYYGFEGYPKGDADMDVNYFNGSVADFYARYNLTAPTDPAPEPSLKGLYFQVMASSLNARTGPGLEYPVKAVLPMGHIVNADAVGGSHVWVRDAVTGLWSCVVGYNRTWMKAL